MPEQIIRQRSVEDSLRYFVTTLTKRAVDTDDMALGGIAIALGMTVDRVKAEIDELRIKLALAEKHERQLDQALDQVIGERDNYHEIADKLAYAVAPEEVIGEHSSMNCPWENALDLITPKAEVDKLRAENREYEKALAPDGRAA